MRAQWRMCRPVVWRTWRTSEASSSEQSRLDGSKGRVMLSRKLNNSPLDEVGTSSVTVRFDGCPTQASFWLEWGSSTARRVQLRFAEVGMTELERLKHPTQAETGLGRAIHSGAKTHTTACRKPTLFSPASRSRPSLS